jgi:ribosome recycling factor
MQGAVDLLAREFAGVRTGRANAGLLDALRVEAYGQPMPLNQLATVSVPDAKTLVIQPWDGSQIGAIEKAILKSDLGLTPANDGKVVRLTLPPLTEERRRQLAKTVGKLAEDARVAVRNVRREANDKLKAMARDKKVSQDEERRGHDQIQKATDRFIARIDELAKKKEQEILSV